MKFKHSIGNGQVSLTFDGKPSANIRAILKRNHFSWSPGNGYWWRRQVTGAADFIGGLRNAIDREAGVRRPDGACWECQSEQGFFRNQGAATPVYCDSCHAKHLRREEDKASPQPDWVDMQYEDDCRDACGL